MARPKKHRNICGNAAYAFYKPNGVAMGELETVELMPDELEALRLADQEGMNQIDAAVKMQVSRQTFGNIIKRARYKVASSIIEGHALKLK
jgi:predicted DNA-binding protein (UPF0251 family)